MPDRRDDPHAGERLPGPAVRCKRVRPECRAPSDCEEPSPREAHAHEESGGACAGRKRGVPLAAFGSERESNAAL